MPRKPKAKLYLRFRAPDGKQSPYCPAVFDSKSRIRNFWCLVNGKAEFHPNGYYYQRVKCDGKEKWESLGTDPHAAQWKSVAEAKREANGTEDVLGLKANQPEQPAPADKAPGYRLDDEVREYLINAAKLATKTYKAYKKSLELFQDSCKKTYVHQIGKQDLQAFDTFLLQRGNDDRTRSNRVGHIVTFLRNEQGRRPGPPITDVSITIKYVESPPEAYTRQELEDLFRVSDEDERFLWRFFLGTGFRESECAVAEGTDVNHDNKLIRVDEKPEFGFKPKDCEKRWVPISDALIAEIAARAKSGCCSLLFDNNGRPDGHLLRRLKRVAFDGGLNCGKCKGTVDGKEVSCGKADVERAAAKVEPRSTEKYAVMIGGRPYPPKQLIEVSLHLPPMAFTTMDAQRILARLGFEVISSDRQAAVETALQRHSSPSLPASRSHSQDLWELAVTGPQDDRALRLKNWLRGTWLETRAKELFESYPPL